jgi:hypothetical protein
MHLGNPGTLRKITMHSPNNLTTNIRPRETGKGRQHSRELMVRINEIEEQEEVVPMHIELLCGDKDSDSTACNRSRSRNV